MPTARLKFMIAVLLLAFGAGIAGVGAAENGNVLGDIMNELLRGSDDGAATPPSGAQDGAAAPEPARRVPFGREDMQLSFAPLVKKTTPAVVNVYATKKPKAVSPFAGDPFFEEFFGGGQMTPRVQQSLGSGVIVDASGLVVTNYHVIANADELKVALADGREFQSKVLLKDEALDLAVLKIDAAQPFPTVPIGDSDAIEIGDLVLAIGNPFGVGQTTTSGIVSALARSHIGVSDFGFFIQTDAAINPGNSGGALVDMGGRLVGINTAIFSRTGGNLGIGFAVPANLARGVMTSLISDGRVTRGYVGAMIQDVTPALARSFKLSEPGGALISEVVPDGPAARAGLQSGDVVTELNGKKVSDMRQFRLRVAETKPGSTVALKVLRDGATKNLNVTIREMPGEDGIVRASATTSDTGVLNDVTVADLDAANRRQFDIPPSVRGALVTEVQPNGPSANAGLKAGDVILEINRKAVKNADEAVKLTDNVSDKTTLLRVWSNGGSRYVVVDENDRNAR